MYYFIKLLTLDPGLKHCIYLSIFKVFLNQTHNIIKVFMYPYKLL